MLELKKNINVFFISGFCAIITMIYLGITFSINNRPSSIPFELIALAMPILYGIFGVINYYIINEFGNNYSLVIGGIFGLLLSFIGRFILDIPKKLFQMPIDAEYIVHISATLLYSVLFRFIITPLNKYLND
jgi:hypothetical protein